MLAILLYICGKGRYAGLGTNLIQLAYSGETVYCFDFLCKLLLTVLTLSIGFQGGEVTPLFAIGACLGAVPCTLPRYSNHAGSRPLLRSSLWQCLQHTARTHLHWNRSLRIFLFPLFRCSVYRCQALQWKSLHIRQTNSISVIFNRKGTHMKLGIILQAVQSAANWQQTAIFP